MSEGIFGFHNWRVLDFPGSPVVKTVLPQQGAWVPSLVGELHMLRGATKKRKKKTKQKH